MKKKHKKKVKLTLTDKTLSSKEALQKIKAIKDKLQDIKEYKAILTADGMQPDEEDKQRESELIKRLLRLEKQAGIVREKPSWRNNSGGKKKTGGKKKFGGDKTLASKSGDSPTRAVKSSESKTRDTKSGDGKTRDSKSGESKTRDSKTGGKKKRGGYRSNSASDKPAPRTAPRPAKR